MTSMDNTNSEHLDGGAIAPGGIQPAARPVSVSIARLERERLAELRFRKKPAARTSLSKMLEIGAALVIAALVIALIVVATKSGGGGGSGGAPGGSTSGSTSGNGSGSGSGGGSGTTPAPTTPTTSPTSESVFTPDLALVLFHDGLKSDAEREAVRNSMLISVVSAKARMRKSSLRGTTFLREETNVLRQNGWVVSTEPRTPFSKAGHVALTAHMSDEQIRQAVEGVMSSSGLGGHHFDAVARKALRSFVDRPDGFVGGSTVINVPRGFQIVETARDAQDAGPTAVLHSFWRTDGCLRYDRSKILVLDMKAYGQSASYFQKLFYDIGGGWSANLGSLISNKKCDKPLTHGRDADGKERPISGTGAARAPEALGMCGKYE